MKRDTLGSLPFKGPGYLFVSFNHQGYGLPAAMEAHKVAEGDPFPPPQRPLTLLSGQTELPTLPL